MGHTKKIRPSSSRIYAAPGHLRGPKMGLSAAAEGLPEEDCCPVCFLFYNISLRFITAESDLEIPIPPLPQNHLLEGKMESVAKVLFCPLGGVQGWTDGLWLLQQALTPHTGDGPKVRRAGQQIKTIFQEKLNSIILD